MMESRLLQAVLVLPVRSMSESLRWYGDVLGLVPVFINRDPVEDPDGNYAILKRDDAEVHLLLDEPPRSHPWSIPGTGYMFLIVRGVAAIYQSLQDRGIDVTRDLKQESWGVPAFQLTDPSGNLILVAEAVTESD